MTATKNTEKKTATATEKKTLKNITVSDLQEKAKKYDFSKIITDDTSCKALTDSEKVKILVYDYVCKALQSDKTLTCFLQHNYKYARNKDSHAFDLIRVCYTNDLKHQLTNVYITVTKDNINLKIYCTANKAYLDALKKAQFDIKKFYKTVNNKDFLQTVSTLKQIYKK